MSSLEQRKTPSDTAWPTTAVGLLEARYQSFANKQVDFILESHHPETRSQVDRASIEAWSLHSEWLGLTIESEKTEKEKAIIDFTVRYRKDHQTVNHRELAEFRMHEGRWYYFDSEFPKPEPVRNEEKIGRNDPCSCGSGKKFKKCHALSES